ncbi:MAG: FAD-dependent oxidoreductase [Kiritimatiellia bacterium]
MNNKDKLALLAAAWASLPCLGAYHFRAPHVEPVERVPGLIWVEAESFADYGNWRLDTQFTHKMGSAYLIAPGVGKPIGSAKTTVHVATSGAYRVWARTKDWLPEFSPGRFRIDVNGAEGAVLGASGAQGWHWECVGDFTLKAGPVELALVDLSGAFARCDAVILSRDLGYVPPDGPKLLKAERMRLTGMRNEVAEGGSFDVVVVGSGTAGMGAAIAAARGGARVALVHDRPVLGGNSSCELGIGTDGAAGAHPNSNYDARETGLVEEANLTRKYVRPGSLSEVYAYMCARESNLSVMHNQRVYAVEKDGDRIVAVIARDTLTGKVARYRAQIFIDCTGDGWVGYFAGAELMHGREAKSEFGEQQAPERRDALIMSGSLMDGYLSYRYRKTDRPVAFQPPAWADVMPAGFSRPVSSLAPVWWLEHHGRFDELADPERARDELIRIVFAYWGWLKNSWKGPDSANAELLEVPFMNGRREGYRLTGDYVLTANDCLAGRVFDDRISYGGWPLDTHDPLGIENPGGWGYWEPHPPVPIYTIPYRCLYSKNIANLMMAGRDVSVTHIALGSVRVESTLFCLGQAAGTAAAMATKSGMTPRQIGRRRIKELQQQLLKDDMYIPGIANEDPADKARGATKITASSVMSSFKLQKDHPDLQASRDGSHRLDRDRACGFARGTLDGIEGLSLLLTHSGSGQAELIVDVYSCGESGQGPSASDLAGTARVQVSPGPERFVDIAFGRKVMLAKPYVWVVCRRNPMLSWSCRKASPVFVCSRAYGREGAWTVSENQGYALVTMPRQQLPVDARPEYVVDGIARPVGTCLHGWISDATQSLPQYVRLQYDRPVKVGQIRLTFDSDLTPRYPKARPKTLVKDYYIDICRADGRWERVVDVKDNGYRLRVHDIPEKEVVVVKVTVTATHGDASARIQEIRLYPAKATDCRAAELEGMLASVPDGGVCLLPAGEIVLRRPVVMRGRKGVTIRGRPGTVVKLHFSPWSRQLECPGAFVFDRCEKIHVEQMVFTTDHPVNASGRVVAIHPESASYDVRIDDQFPITGAEQFRGLDTFDEEGMPDYAIETYNDSGNPIDYTVIGHQLVRVQGPSAARVKRLHIGHRVLYRYVIYGSAVFSVEGCRDMTFRDIEVGRCASFGMRVTPHSHNLTLERFNVRSPAGDRALFSANADGVHILGLSGKLTMRDCHFKGLGDDALNIHGKSGEVKSFDAATGSCKLIGRNLSRSETRLPQAWAETGCRLVVYDSKTCVEKGVVTLTAFDSATGEGRVSCGACPMKVGDYVANERDFAQVEIANCSVENTRARAFVLQSRNMVVDGCRFKGLSLPAILVATDFTFWNECGPAKNCEIRNCRFEKCAMNGSAVNKGAIVVKVNHDGDFANYPAGVHRDIRVKGNRFVNCEKGVAFFSSTDGVLAENNVSRRGDADFGVLNCTNVIIRGNRAGK